MKTLRIKKRQLTVALYQERWLYVYSGIQRQHIFSFQDDIVDFCLDEGEDTSWLLWAVSREGHVYRMAEKDINHQMPSEPCASDNAIFEELIQDIPDISFTPSTESSSHISSKDAVFTVDPKGAAICAHTDILAIATIKKRTCILNIYAKKDLASDGEPKETCFSTTLCLPNSDFNDVSLYIVASSANRCFSGSGNLCLEPLVFNSLFGTQTSILDSAVILLTFSDGYVYYLPLKRWLSSSQQNDGDFSILCDLNSPISHIFVVDIESLDSEDPIDQMNFSQFLTSFKESGSRFPALLVCSWSGQCCLFSSPDYFKTNLQVMQKTIIKDGPIVASCPGEADQQFYYSTGKNIVSVEFSFGDQLEVSEQVYTKLAGIKNMASVSEKGETFLLCQSENGRFYSLPKLKDEFGTSDTIVCSKNTIPNLLARVDEITKKMDQINPNIKHQSHILSQLALASHLYLNASGTPKDNKQLVHALQVSISVKRINGCTALCCRVTSCRMVLSSDWSLLVETHPLFPVNEETVHRSSFKSVCLKRGLQPGESVEVAVVQNLEIPSNTRVSISAWLVLNLQLHDLGLYSSSSFHVGQLKALEEQGLTIHIFESQTDFLDFVVGKELHQSEADLGTESKCTASASLVIDSIARKRPVYSAFEDLPMIVAENMQEKFMYRILIPDYLSAFLSDHTCHDATHRSCVLKDLLCKIKIPYDKEMSGTSVILDTTDWDQVTIGVEKSSDKSSKYCMEIQSGAPGTLVEMVLALMRRIKKLLPSELTKSVSISEFITEIQKAKENLRSFEEDLKDSKEADIEKLMKHLLYFFLDVHNIDYQISCQLHV